MKKYRRLFVLAVILAAAIVLYSVFASAVWNPDKAVQFTAAQYEEVEPSTFLIGTHLIHLNALTDQLYDIAEKSAEASGQETIYYKSELADGTWFDITTASTLTDITSGGTPIATDKLTERYLTHQTGSDGVTIDLRTGDRVNPYDIIDPFDLQGLDELMPLKNQYDLIREQQKDSAAGKEKMARIEEIFETDLENTVTENANSGIEALQAYYDTLTEKKTETAMLDKVQDVMDALDATRRAEVFRILEPIMDEYCIELTKMEDSQDDEGDVTVAEGGDSALQTAANDSYQNVTNSKIEQEGNMLAEGETVASQANYEISMRLIDHAKANSYSACDEDVRDLIALDNIDDGTVADKTRELRLLDDMLLPKATTVYLDHLAAGETAEYRQAAGKDAAGALLKGIRKEGVSETNAARTELESFITAKTDRLCFEDGIKFIDERLDQASGYYGKVKKDDFEDDGRESVDKHIDFLTKKKRDLEKKLGGNELDKARAEKSDLQNQMLSALDKNDLDGAKKLEDQMNDLDDKIKGLEGEQTANLNDLQNKKNELENKGDLTDSEQDQLNDLNAKLAEAKNSMSDGSMNGLIQTLRGDALDLIGNGSGSASDRSGLDGILDSLGGLLPDQSAGVFPALKDIHGALTRARDLDGDNGFGDQIDKVEDMILNNANAFEASMNGDKTIEQLKKDADEVLNGKDTLDAGGMGMGGEDSGLDLSSLSGDEKDVALIIALDKYMDQTGSKNAETLRDSTLENAFGLGNPYVFFDLTDDKGEYVAVKSVGVLHKMRYVWNKNYRCATLARGTKYYSFTVHSDAVTKGRTESEVEYMDAPTKYKSGAYIPESYSETNFEATAYPIEGSGLAVLYSKKLVPVVNALLEKFLS